MASPHLFTNIIPQIMADGLEVLRENAILPRLVNRKLEREAGEFGSTIDIPVIDDATVVTVTPDAAYPAAVTVQPTKVQLALDWWREVPFSLEDKELHDIKYMETVKLRSGAAMKALANAVDVKIHLLYKDTYLFGGVPGTTPFGTTVTALIDARAALNRELCPPDNRKIVLDVDADAAAMGLPSLHDYDRSGNMDVSRTGAVRTRYGASWYLNQNVTAWTSGITWGSFDSLLICTAVATGDTSMELRSTSSGPTLYAGDIFHLAGDPAGQCYVCTTEIATTGTVATVVISPAARKSYATTILATGVATGVVNLYFDPQAFAWASRPLSKAGALGALGSLYTSISDPVSGLAFRLEVSRQYKLNRWAWDILGGAVTTRPALACRLYG